jgi:hypothetical protein
MHPLKLFACATTGAGDRTAVTAKAPPPGRGSAVPKRYERAHLRIKLTDLPDRRRELALNILVLLQYCISMTARRARGCGSRPDVADPLGVTCDSEGIVPVWQTPRCSQTCDA